MGFVRGLMLAGCGCLFVGGLSAQIVAEKDWYPADTKNLVPSWTHGVEGKPFVGRAKWVTTGRDPEYGDGYMRTESVDVMRDGKGRERLSWGTLEADSRVATEADVRTVLLLDAVLGCVFLWMEDGTGKSLNAVKVRCEPEGVPVPVRPAWNALTAYEEKQLTIEPESKPRYEDVAGKTEDVGGVKATSYKHEEVRVFDAGKRVQRTVDEVRWYSEALGMVVRTGEGDSRPFYRDDATSFSMDGVNLGEPAAEKFALPVGAEVEVDPKLRLVWEDGARGQGNRLHAATAISSGEWPSVHVAAMTDQVGRTVHPAYPEAWFEGGPTVPIPTFYAGQKGKPFEMSGQFNVYGPGVRTYESQPIFFEFSQDSEGRDRIKFRFLNGGDIEPVYLADGVSGCIFQWSVVEPWVYDKIIKAEKKAKVRCQAHGVVLPPLPRWDDLKDDEKALIAAAGADKLRFVREKVGEEKVGGYRSRMSMPRDQVATVKYVEYAVYAATEGKPERKVLVGEEWYSPEIDRVVKASLVPPAETGSGAKVAKPSARVAAAPLVVMDVQTLTLGEPVEEFYPPRGYAIEVDQTLLPPFAPVAKAAVKKAKPQ